MAIAREGELAENAWKVFNYPDEYAQGISINLPGHGLVAYSDVCTHLSCAVLYQGDGNCIVPAMRDSLTRPLALFWPVLRCAHCH